MKRSEMTKLIENYLNEHAHPLYLDVPNSKIADDILTIAEKYMKPPENGYDYEGGYEGDEYYCVTVPCYEWENE